MPNHQLIDITVTNYICADWFFYVITPKTLIYF